MLTRVAARMTLATTLAAGTLLVLAHALGWSAMIVRSGSMAPAVPVGSLVVARPVSGGDVRVGDAIAVRRNGTDGAGVTVLHRVVALQERNGQRFAQLKGDANPVADPEPAALTEPVARPVAIIPRAGYAVSALQTSLPPSRMLLAAAGLLALWLIWGAGAERHRRAA
jgi:signal peptidase I